MKQYRDLVAWQKSMDLVEEIYHVSRSFPDDEKYGLVIQLRRAAISVPSNIAEGHSRPTSDFIRFLNMSRGSLSEVETQLEISRRLGFLDEGAADDLIHLAATIGRIINGLIRSLRTEPPTKEKQP